MIVCHSRAETYTQGAERYTQGAETYTHTQTVIAKGLKHTIHTDSIQHPSATNIVVVVLVVFIRYGRPSASSISSSASLKSLSSIIDFN